MKTAYSAWSKMRRKGVPLQALHDVLGLRIIIRPTAAGKLSTAHHWQRQTILCYRALEVVHRLYPPPPGRRIKDYVASPKPNGYQVESNCLPRCAAVPNSTKSPRPP
jgi:(p)ppGpp synthase/HD superfamily hydrolase